MGTGRVTRLLRGAGARVLGCDRAPAMIAEARRRQDGAYVLADAVAPPAASGAFDAAVAAWVFGHFTEWGQDKLEAALGEMERAVRPGGVLAILETMGTGADAPAPPTEGLAAYYRGLEARGFLRELVATDYLFANVDEAAAVCGWFFGDALAERIRARGWTRVPEWTALFSRVRG